MNTYTYSSARQNLSSLLEDAKKTGKVLIKRRDGSIFEVRPVSNSKSPFDVEGINSDVTSEEIVNIVRESRESSYGV